MNPVHLIVGLIFVAVVLSTVAQKLRIPYPSLLVVGGVAVGFVPGLPRVQIPPDVAFLLFIPPLVYLVATQFGVRDLRSHVWPILRLSVGLMLLNLFCVAGIVHASIADFSWPMAFVLAAVVGPTDTAAVAAVANRLPVPRRVERILEGESLFNDVVALVAYQQAVKAVVSGSWSVGETAVELVWDAVGGVVAGLLVGASVTWARRRLCDTSTDTAVSLLTPFAAYLAAEVVDASGVLATVAAGLYVGRYLLAHLGPSERLQAFSFWNAARFILESLAFVLIGLELRSVLGDVGRLPPLELLRDCAWVCGATIVLRMAWMLFWNLFPCAFYRRLKPPRPAPPWQHAVLIGWSGMRGVDSLAAALAVPLVLADGVTPFPQRSLILFLSFSVILTTLVLQGLTLPLLIRRLRLPADDSLKREELRLRLAAAEAAQRRLDELCAERRNVGKSGGRSSRNLSASNSALPGPRRAGGRRTSRAGRRNDAPILGQNSRRSASRRGRIASDGRGQRRSGRSRGPLARLRANEARLRTAAVAFSRLGADCAAFAGGFSAAGDLQASCPVVPLSQSEREICRCPFPLAN
ncbi:MAG: Na+/H+ antiporter [Pirellulales bacterium]